MTDFFEISTAQKPKYIKETSEAIEQYLECFESKGKPLPKKITLRKDIYSKILNRAKTDLETCDIRFKGIPVETE